METKAEKQELYLSRLEKESKKIQPVRTNQFIPIEMVVGVNKAIQTFGKAPEDVSDDIKIRCLDRYVVYDDHVNLTIEVFQFIVLFIRMFPSWDEAYYAHLTDAETEEKLAELRADGSLDPADRSKEYNESLHDEHYYMVRYRPTKMYSHLLYLISKKFDYPYPRVLARDEDIRIRRERFISPEMSIRTPFGRDYLFLSYHEKESGMRIGSYFNVGNACIVCLKEEDVMFCSICKEAVYCCGEHQKQDWPNHKKICTPPRGPLLSSPPPSSIKK